MLTPLASYPKVPRAEESTTKNFVPPVITGVNLKVNRGEIGIAVTSLAT